MLLNMAATFGFRNNCDICDPLMQEIWNLIMTLKSVEIGVPFTVPNPADIMEQHAKRISEVLNAYTDGIKCSHTILPIHQLLSVSPLTKTEIPVQIVAMLASAQLSLNDFDRTIYSSSTSPCLQRAIIQKHYNVVKCLVEHGADLDFREDPNHIGYGNPMLHDAPFPKMTCKAAIVELASNADVPLELFNVLKTQKNLNDKSCIDLPLHTALSHGHVESALHLIKLGADINQPDGYDCLPIEHFVKRYTQKRHAQEFNEEMFETIMPSSSCSNGILRSICSCLDDENGPHDSRVSSEILHQLLQRLILSGPLSVKIETYKERPRWVLSDDSRIGVQMTINDSYQKKTLHPQILYKISLMLILLDVDVLSLPDAIAQQCEDPELSDEELLSGARAIDRLWEDYRNKPTVRSLFSLCIRQTRNSMKSLSDRSFKSLPVAPTVMKSLMYHEVAEEIVRYDNNFNY